MKGRLTSKRVETLGLRTATLEEGPRKAFKCPQRKDLRLLHRYGNSGFLWNLRLAPLRAQPKTHLSPRPTEILARPLAETTGLQGAAPNIGGAGG